VQLKEKQNELIAINMPAFLAITKLNKQSACIIKYVETQFNDSTASNT
jgi:predicted PP-loop superfamily ATPase